MLRLVDLFALLGIAVVVLLPKATVRARPGLEGAPVELDRIARAQDTLARNPEDVKAAIELAEGFLSAYRTDWALSTMAPFVEREKGGRPADARVHLMIATARAERLEPPLSAEAAARAVAICEEVGEGSPRCPFGVPARAQLVRGAMKALADLGIDPVKEPARAKQEVYRALRPSRPGY